MSVSTPAKLHIQDELRRIAEQLDNCPHGKKSTILASVKAHFGWSTDTLYRKLKDIGWDSGKAKRSDAGKTSVSEQALSMMEAMRMQSVRKNGKTTMHTPVAKSILSQNGHDINVSVSTINRLSRLRSTTDGDMKRASPSTIVRSLHPNHVHQVDPSLCVLYYMPNGEQRIMESDQFYKNKLDSYNKVKLKCWRYVLTDHTSNTIIVKYYATEGENSTNLWDFLCYAWAKQKGRVFYGVPQILYWDKGSANTSGPIRNALDQLDVKHLTHEKGRARAKGSVEGANNNVEIQFECRLKLEPVDNVDQLNAAVEHWYNAYNSNSIKGQDTRLNRPGMRQPAPRYGLWQTIKAAQLRELPNEDICKTLLASTPVERQIEPNLTISFVHPKVRKSCTYSLRDCAHALVGKKVLVSALVYSQADVRITLTLSDGSKALHDLSPVVYDELYGMPLDAPVFGENYIAMPDTDVEKRKKVGDKLAYPDLDEAAIQKAKDKQLAPFGGTINAHSFLAQQAAAAPGFMQKQGTPIVPPSTIVADERSYDRLDIKDWLHKRLMRDFEAHEVEWLNKFTTVKQSELNGILEQIRAGVPAAPVLRVVNNK
jgi:hypothetical protein